MRKKIKTTIGYEVKRDSDTELLMREVYCSTVVEILNSWGVDEFSVEKLHGALIVLEQFNFLMKKIDNVK